MRSALLVLAFGCGRIAFSPLDETVAGDGSVALDAPIDASLCMTDTFDTLSTTAYEEFGGGTVAVVNGRLETSIPGVQGIDGAIQTTPPRSFVGLSIAIEIVAVGMYMEAVAGPGWHTASDAVHFHVQQGMLVLFDSNGVIESQPYDAVAHRWLRMRESGGTVYAEVSPNGASWTPFGASAGVDSSVAWYDLGINPGTGLPGPDKAVFDNLAICP